MMRLFTNRSVCKAGIKIQLRDKLRERSRGRSVSALAALVIACCLNFAGTVYAQDQTRARARTVNESPAAEATLILNEQFLNSFLDAIFTHLREPEFPLSISHNEPKNDREGVHASHAARNTNSVCASVIVLERERGGVRTAVRFEDGHIVAPLAFSGSYNGGLLGCVNFSGTANSIVTLEFDRARQALMARVQVREVQLIGAPRLANQFLVSLVQNSIDKRFNPYELFKAEQLSPTIPIRAAGGSLRLRTKDMRPEIIPGALRIHIIYEFVRGD